MTSIDLWNRASTDTRDAANLLQGEQSRETVEKALRKLRSATAAMEALQRLSAGVPQPKQGE